MLRMGFVGFFRRLGPHLHGLAVAVVVVAISTSGLVVLDGIRRASTVGAVGTASIGDRVFEDFSGDGVAGTGEPGRAGVRVALAGAGPDGLLGNGDDVLFTPVLSGASGGYLFSSLDAGLFRVSVSAPPGFAATTVSSFDVTLAAAQAYTTADFGVREGDASIGDAVFGDADSSGVRDGAELGVGGVSLTLRRGSTVVATATSLSDGSYSFPNLPAGSYTVTATLPSGSDLTTVLNPFPVELGAGEHNAVADFGVRSVGASIGDYAFNDLNGNGVADAGEPPLANLSLSLFQGPTLLTTTRTELTGAYLFTFLPAGSYIVVATAPPGATNTTGNASAPVILADGQVVSNVDYGYAGVSFVPAAVTTVAGNGANATLDGTGSGASFRDLGGTAVVNGYAYQFTYGSMRKVRLADGVVTTLAGHATASGCTDNIDPTLVRFSSSTLSGVATDGTSLFILDCGKIRKIDIATGATTSIGSGFLSYQYHLVYAGGFLYVSAGSNTSGPIISRVDPATGSATAFATLPANPGSTYNFAGPVTSDASALYVLEESTGGAPTTHSIQRVDLATAAVTTLAAGATVGGAPCLCPNEGALVGIGNYLYGSSGSNNSVLRRWSKTDGSMNAVAGADIYSGATEYQDGVGPEAWFRDAITGLASDGSTLIAADSGNLRVRRITPAAPYPAAQSPTATQTVAAQQGAAVTFAGDGTNATVDGIGPTASFMDMGNAVVVGDYAYVGTTASIRKVNLKTGVVTTLAGSPVTPTGCIDSPNPASVRFMSADDGQLTTDGTFLYLADRLCHKVRRISIATGATSMIADIFTAAYITFAPDGYLYVAAAPSGTVIYRVDPATGVTSTFKAFGSSDSVGALAADGTSLWAEYIPPDNSKSLLKISLADGSVTTIRSGIPTLDLNKDILTSTGSYLYSADELGTTVRRFSKVDGTFLDIAGDPSFFQGGYVEDVGRAARFKSINGISSDGKRLWINDSGNHRLRVVDDLQFFDPQSSRFGFDQYGAWSDDVNVGLGNFVTAETDVSVAGIGPELGVTRTYNSLDPRIAAFGQGWSFNYDMTWLADPAGNVSVIYPDGRREVHTKNGDGSFTPPPSYYSKLVSNGSGGYTLTQKDGQVVAFNSSGKVTSITDANGKSVTLAYDGSGFLSTATSAPSGRVLTFTWSAGRVSSVSTQSVAAYGHVLTWSYTYSGASLTKVCNPRDTGVNPPYCTTYTYTVGRLSMITKPRGNTSVEIHYAPDGKVDWRKDGLGHLTRFLYPSPGVVRVIDPRGAVTKREYDTAKFFETKETDPSGAVTSYRYDAGDNRDQITDPNLGVTTMVFDARRNVTQQTDAEGKISYFTFDAADNMTAVRDPRSASSADNTYKSAFTYSTSRNKLTQTSPPTTEFPSGNTVTWAYTVGTETAIGGGTMPAGLVKTETDARSGVTTNSYDSKGDLRRVVDRAGLQTDYTYDELGRRLTETQTSDTYPAGLTTTTTYDELGQALTVTGPSVTNAVTSAAHRLKVTNTYDANENRVSSVGADIVGTDAARTSSYEFDNNDREVTMTDPENGRMTRVFDPTGNAVLVTDQDGHTIETTYDTRNLPTAIVARDVIDDPLAPSTPHTIIQHVFTYDPARRQATDTDALGRQQVSSYDKDNRPTKTDLVGYHNPDGSTRTITLNEWIYDAAGQVTTEKSGGGLKVTTNVWDAARRMTSSTLDPGTAPKLNRTTSYTFDANGNITKTLLADAARTDETRFAFDANDRMTVRTVEYGTADLITTYGFDKRGLMTTIVDPRGNVSGGTPTNFRTDYASDELGRPKTVTAPTVSIESNGGTATNSRPVTTYGYDTYGNRTNVKDPRNNTTSSAFDKLSRRTGITYPAYTIPGGGTLTPTEAFTFDSAGNLTAQVDRRGQRTDNVFDTLNRVRRQTDPLVTGQTQRGVLSTEWDDAGNQTARIDQTGARSEATYDDLNRVRSRRQIVRQPTLKTLTTAFDYDDLGNPILQTDPLGHGQTATYDAASEMKTSVDALSKVTSYTYDVASKLTSTTDPMNFQLVNTYDNAERLASTIQRKTGSTDIVTSYGRDENDNITTRTSPRGFATTSTYDALNQLRTVVEPVTSTTSITTSYGYDAAGNATRSTDGRSNITVATYQPWDLREDIVEPSTTAYPAATDRTYRNSYDAGGLTTNVSLPAGVNRQRAYDELGRMNAETGIQPGQANITKTFGYDLASRQTSASHPNGTINLTWDDRNLLLGTTGGAGTSSFVYDDANRMTARTDGAGAGTFGWTNRNELQTEADPLTGVTRTNTWDDSGRLSTVALAPGGETRTYGYDPYHRLTGDALKNAANTTLAGITYGYDPSGNVTNKTTTLTGNAGAGANVYTYDRKERLASWTNPAAVNTAYTWDNSGNRTTVGTATSTFDARNRLLTKPSTTSYTYTARGTRATRLVGSTTTNYTFDAFDRLTSYNGTVAYGYDAYDRIASRAGTNFTYAGRELDPVTTGSPYTYAHSPSGDLIGLTDGTNPRVVGQDRHGDLAWLLNGPAAAVTDTRAFNPFGQSTGTTGTLTPPVGFQSDYTDPTSSLVDMGARWYEPSTDNFISRDTITPMLRTPVSLNMYTYAANNPLSYMDPDGRMFGWVADLADDIGCHSCAKFIRHAERAVTKFVSETVNSAVEWGRDHIARPVARYARSAVHYVSAATSRSYAFIKGGLSAAGRFGMRATSAAISFAKRAGGGIASGITNTWNSCMGSSGCRTILGATALVVGAAVCAACVAPMLWGALGGGLIGGGIGLATCGGDTACVARSTGMGILGGAGAGLGVGMLSAVGAGAAVQGAGAGFLGESFNQLVAGHFDAKSLAVATLTGAVVAGVGSKVAQALRPAEGAATKVAPSEIRLSQATVNGPRTSALADDMAARGWQGDPVDVVRMPDGRLTTFDNKRVVAANDAGIDVSARIQDFDAPFPGGRLGPKSPGTWGEAVTERIGNQKPGWRNCYPMGAPFTCRMGD